MNEEKQEPINAKEALQAIFPSELCQCGHEIYKHFKYKGRLPCKNKECKCHNFKVKINSKEEL